VPFRRRFIEQLAKAHRSGQLHFFAQHAALADARHFAQWLAPLPSDALGLSRYRLDFALIEEASRMGVVVREMRVCIGVSGDLQNGF